MKAEEIEKALTQYRYHGSNPDQCQCVPCSKYRMMLKRGIRRKLIDIGVNPANWVTDWVGGSTHRARSLYNQIVINA